jgi:YHS domain-containing protein
MAIRSSYGLDPGTSVSSLKSLGTEAPMAIETDPVCGMQVDTETSDLKLEHDGKTYWFCGRGCMLEFRDDPEKYLDPDYQPSM